LDSFGYEVEIGKYACQADGAVWIKQGGTVVLATVVSAPTPGFSRVFTINSRLSRTFFLRQEKFLAVILKEKADQLTEKFLSVVILIVLAVLCFPLSTLIKFKLCYGIFCR